MINSWKESIMLFNHFLYKTDSKHTKLVAVCVKQPKTWKARDSVLLGDNNMNTRERAKLHHPFASEEVYSNGFQRQRWSHIAPNLNDQQDSEKQHEYPFIGCIKILAVFSIVILLLLQKALFAKYLFYTGPVSSPVALRIQYLAMRKKISTMPKVFFGTCWGKNKMSFRFTFGIPQMLYFWYQCGHLA